MWLERFATTAETYCGSVRPVPRPKVANHLIGWGFSSPLGSASNFKGLHL
jgi:hypothetical protein